MNKLLCTCLICCSWTAGIWADGPTDNRPEAVRPIPPIGEALSAEQQIELEQELSEIESGLVGLETDSAFPLVAVIPRSVRLSISTKMFYTDKDVAQARELLAEGRRRLRLLKEKNKELGVLGVSNVPLSEPQTLAAGFRSRIDSSIQPYGLVLPIGWTPTDQQPMRLDVWLHGRGEKTSEVAFMVQRSHQVGEYSPAGTVVLHPYGRYSNAFKFAGEIDVLEAIEHVQRFLPIDRSRITIRGFSMGGAGCWQMAVHYPDIFAAANPGAGFSETMDFLRVFQGEEFRPTPYQRKLLHWYDCPDWTNNLRNVPTVAYSGEIDKQKQAADVMEAAYRERGLELPHVIGPDTAHKIHPESKVTIENFLDKALRDGKATVPKKVDLTTYSLRYHQIGWLSIEGLEKHWEESRVQGELDQASIHITTSGVTELRLQFEFDQPFRKDQSVTLVIDESTLHVQPNAYAHEGTWQIALHSSDAGWVVQKVVPQPLGSLVKRPGLQGPIDDAFMDQFAWVPPVAADTSNLVHRWIANEYTHATREWQRHFRGDIVELDGATVRSEYLHQNLVLFGTPATNAMLAKIAERLPIQWDEDQLIANGQQYSASTHVPVLIYPNPLSPEHYVVINSGFTFREYAYLNNARQIPMLPDWAILDITSPVTSQLPTEKISAAGFFNEQWGW